MPQNSKGSPMDCPTTTLIDVRAEGPRGIFGVLEPLSWGPRLPGVNPCKLERPGALERTPSRRGPHVRPVERLRESGHQLTAPKIMYA